MLEAEVGVGALGAGESLATARIQVCGSVQTSRVPRHQRGLPTGMTDAGESLQEPFVLRRAGGPPSPISNFRSSGGAADMALTRWTTPGVNLGRVVRVGSWNVLKLSEDHRLPYLSDELSKMKVDMVGLSETRRPGSGETSSKGFTYYWSSRSNGHHVKRIAIGISSRLQPSVVEVTPVDERIMRLRLKYNLGFMSVVAVYAPTEMCETEEKEMFYTKLDSVLYSLSWATLMLSLALKGLAVKYVLAPMGVVPEMTTALSFCILQDPEG